MFESIFVTSRLLSPRTLEEQVSCVLDPHRSTRALPYPTRLILREKDLDDADYALLAQRIAPLCDAAGVEFLWQSHVEAAQMMHERWACCRRVQMGMGDFLTLAQSTSTARVRDCFELCWVSVHSLEEAQLAASLGADALIYGHVFETSCKPGLAARGTQQLERIIQCLDIPVYAIGGITTRGQCERLSALGCAGACIMSGYMTMG